MLGEVTVIIDCDVIEADGGTRSASITGGCVALYDALSTMGLANHPMNFFTSAISVGVVGGNVLLDLDYPEDSTADVDLNVVMSENGSFIEIQGTAEKVPFNDEQLQSMLGLARKGCMDLIDAQKKALGGSRHDARPTSVNDRPIGGRRPGDQRAVDFQHVAILDDRR